MLFKKTIKEVSLDELLDEMWQTFGESANAQGKVLIKADSAKIGEQKRDMKIMEGLIDEIKAAQKRDNVFMCAAIAVGYANAMEVHTIITEKELKRLNAMIGAIAERRLAEVDRLERKKVFNYLLHFGRVGA